MMTFWFETESGSRYEVDLDGKRIRRVEGMHDPTKRQGADGEWQPYARTTRIVVGECVFIDWDGEGHGTLTSPVTVTSR